MIDDRRRHATSKPISMLRLAEISGSNEHVLQELETLVAGNEKGQAGVAQLAELAAAARAAGVDAQRLRIDPSIARGLDYYTSTVFETFLDQLPGIGSVCSGGRYDNLAGLYTKEELPGIGASLGLDRLLAALEELGLIQKVSTPAPVFIPFFDATRLHDYLRLAAAIRAAGMGVELYPEPKKLGQQLKYADRRGFRFAVIVGESEWAAGNCQLKDLAAGSSTSLTLDEVPAALRTALATGPSTGRDGALAARLHEIGRISRIACSALQCGPVVCGEADFSMTARRAAGNGDG